MPAKIVTPNLRAPISCVVREISPAGAKLEVEESWAIPRSFWLRIDGDSCMHVCRVMWRKGSNAGVQFPSGHDTTWWEHSQALFRPLPLQLAGQ